MGKVRRAYMLDINPFCPAVRRVLVSEFQVFIPSSAWYSRDSRRTTGWCFCRVRLTTMTGPMDGRMERMRDSRTGVGAMGLADSPSSWRVGATLRAMDQ